MSRILIAGCGDIGTGLGLELADRGHDVWGLRRNPARIPHPINALSADLAVPATLQAIPQQLDWIFIIITADHYDDISYKMSYVEGTRNLLAVCNQRQENLPRVVFVSSTSVFGQSNGEWITEESTTFPKNFAGLRILEAESLICNSSFPSTVVRFAGIYGPDRTRFIDRVRRREIACSAKPPHYRNLIHRRDVIGILSHLISINDPRSIYHGVDNEPVDRFELVQWISSRLGMPSDKPDERKAVPSKRDAGNKRCRNNRIVETGYTFKYPTYREGYGEIIEGIGGLRDNS